MSTLTEVPAPNRDAVLSALATVGEAAAALLKAHPDPDRPVPGLTWSTSRLGAHLVAATEVYADIVAGKGTPYPSTASGIRRVNEETAQAVLDRGTDLAEQVRSAVANLRDNLAASRDESVPWNDGIPLAPTRVAGIQLGELLVHGWDLARAHGRAWPLSPVHVDIVAASIWPIVPRFLSPKARGFTGSYRLRLRGRGTYDIVFRNGVATTGIGAGRVDCTISADPATYILAVYGRVGQVRPALTGRMLVYGRKPWLGLRFNGFVEAP